MATSGSLTTSKYDGRYYKLAWTRTGYSTADNTSTIKWTLSAHGGNSSYYAERTLKVVIAGTTVKSKTASVNRYTGEIDSGTITLKHNTDGTRSFTASVEAAVYYSTVNCTGSKTFELTEIDRISTVSATNANVGAVSTITIKRANSGFKHTLEWDTGDDFDTIVSKTTATSYKWTVPADLLYKFTTTKTKNITIRCYTYTSGGTELGFHEDTITITAGSTYAPTLNPTVTTYAKTQELCGNGTTLIGGISEATIAFNASGKYDATIKSKKVTLGTKYRTTDGDFNNCETGEFIFTATDSRGLTSTVTKKLTVIPYIKPTINLKVKIGVDGKATITANGKFFSGSFGAKTNALNIQFRYKESGGSFGSWTNFATASPGTNTWSASHTLNLDYQKTYVFEAHATDLADYSANSGEKTVRAYPVWDWGEKNFHVHGDLRIDNNFCLTGKKTDGGKYNMVHINTNNDVVIGGGSYPPQNIYLGATGGTGGNVSASNDGIWYSLLGAAKAMANTYTLSTSVSAGTGYSSCSASAYLIGNCLRFSFGATRDTNATTGNITNETVMTVTIDHGGKIDNLYRVSAGTDTEGGAAAFSVQAAKHSTDANKMVVTVILASTTTNLKTFTSYCVMPANIKLNAYL